MIVLLIRWRGKAYVVGKYCAVVGVVVGIRYFLTLVFVDAVMGWHQVVLSRKKKNHVFIRYKPCFVVPRTIKGCSFCLCCDFDFVTVVSCDRLIDVGEAICLFARKIQ